MNRGNRALSGAMCSVGVSVKPHRKITVKGKGAHARTLDSYFLCGRKRTPTGNAPEGLSVPPAGGTAKAVGGGLIGLLRFYGVCGILSEIHSPERATPIF